MLEVQTIFFRLVIWECVEPILSKMFRRTLSGIEAGIEAEIETETETGSEIE